MALSMTHGQKTIRQKVEALAAKYPISVRLDSRSTKELVTEEGQAQGNGGLCRRLKPAFAGV
jgi:hypothetical protein